jgi:hypothetical protein
LALNEWGQRIKEKYKKDGEITSEKIETKRLY